MGEGLGVFLERTSVGDQKKVASRVAGGGVGVGAEEEAEWIQENRVEERGEDECDRNYRRVNSSI